MQNITVPHSVHLIHFHRLSTVLPKDSDHVRAVNAMTMVFDDLIHTDQCYDAISKKTTELLAPNVERREIELTILSSMTQCIKAFNQKLNVYPFGSAVYGICDFSGNYNILIDTSKYAMYTSEEISLY